MSADLLPPPPDPKDTRAFRDWLYAVYRLLNGGGGELAMTADAVSPNYGQAAASVAASLAEDAVSIQLSSVTSRLAEMQKTIDGMMAMQQAIPLKADDVSMISAVRQDIGALHKRLDEVMAWQ